jgi:hypothetical protein
MSLQTLRQKSDSLPVDFKGRFRIRQLPDDLAVLEVHHIDPAPLFRISLKAFFDRRPLKLPAVEDLLLGFVDEGLFLYEAETAMVDKPLRPCPPQILPAFCLTAGPVFEEDVLVEQFH